MSLNFEIMMSFFKIIFLQEAHFEIYLFFAHLDNGDELILDPGVIVDQARHRLPIDCCVERIGELVKVKWV